MGSTLQQIRSRLGTRGLAATAALLVALVVAVATPEILGTRVAAAFGALDNADPKWLWLAGIGFSLAVISAAGSWCSAIRTCGGELPPADPPAPLRAAPPLHPLLPPPPRGAAGAAL